MKILINGILWALLTAFMCLTIVYGIDIHVAREDYLRAKRNGEYEKPITGCMFDFVCERYTKELWK